MMTRRLLAFFAPALLMMLPVACGNKQRIAPIEPHYTMGKMCLAVPQEPPSLAFPRSNPRPKNGECPVCGTMAQPYHEGAGSTQEAFYPWVKYSRLTICEHCNTVFRQWAEGKEPKR